jgi:arogenate dehydrogenase (NADP+)
LEILTSATRSVINLRIATYELEVMKIGIVGLGLIGASLAGDLRQQGHYLLGVSRQLATCETAIAQGMVDSASQDLASLQAAEVIFICTPIALILPAIEQLVPHLHPDTIITDAGSVKGAIVAPATQLWANFVGGHPMAGKEESGIAAAELGMFRGNPYILTPLDRTPAANVEKVRDLVLSLDCRYYEATPEQHDRAVAWISHLPVMVSASLIQACLREGDSEVLNLAQNLASSGFKDTSRVGGGNPELGRMMAEYNRDALLQSLYGYQAELSQTIAAIESHQWDRIQAVLDQNQSARPKFLNS